MARNYRPHISLNLIAASAAVMLLASCSPKLYAPAATDTVRVEYRERLVVDTVIIEIPREVERIITKDTTSSLENSYAKSTATVSEGLLNHSLETKPQKISKPVVVTVRDTIYIEKASETQIEYKEKELTWWQRFKQEAGGIMLGIIVAAIIALILKVVLKI